MILKCNFMLNECTIANWRNERGDHLSPHSPPNTEVLCFSMKMNALARFHCCRGGCIYVGSIAPKKKIDYYCIMTSKAFRFICTIEKKKTKEEERAADPRLANKMKSKLVTDIHSSIAFLEWRRGYSHCPTFCWLFIFNLKFQFEFKSKRNGNQK